MSAGLLRRIAVSVGLSALLTLGVLPFGPSSASTAGVNGVALQDAMNAESSRLATIESRRGATLLPIVRALRSRSNE